MLRYHLKRCRSWSACVGAMASSRARISAFPGFWKGCEPCALIPLWPTAIYTYCARGEHYPSCAGSRRRADHRIRQRCDPMSDEKLRLKTLQLYLISDKRTGLSLSASIGRDRSPFEASRRVEGMPTHTASQGADATCDRPMRKKRASRSNSMPQSRGSESVSEEWGSVEVAVPTPLSAGWYSVRLAAARHGRGVGVDGQQHGAARESGLDAISAGVRGTHSTLDSVDERAETKEMCEGSCAPDTPATRIRPQGHGGRSYDVRGPQLHRKPREEVFYAPSGVARLLSC